MQIDARQIFNKVEPKIKRLGFDSYFLNLGDESGPINPGWAKGQVIYEIYVRAFSEEGTFNAVKNALPALKEKGIEIIWFMPIFPIGQVHRKGSLGCPYSIKDYFTVNPEYGTENDFKNLVQTAHRLGLKVLIDMVPNHVAHDYVYLKKIPQLVKYDDQGRPLRKIADWTDVADLDYSQKATWQHMASVMEHWIKKFDIDGYRCDVAGLVPLSFWEWIIPQLRQLKNDFFLLAEWESHRLHLTGFNSSYDWSTLDLFRLALKQQEPLETLAEWALAKKSFYPKNALPLRFLENHDLPRAASQFNNAQLLTGLLFIFTLHGIPLIYNGQEIGASQTPSLFEKEPVDWQKKNPTVERFLEKLIALRKELPDLSSSQYSFVEKYFKEDIWHLKKNNLVVVINFSGNERKIPLPNGKLILNTSSKFETKQGQLILNGYQGLLFMEKN
ncbi:MAG: hypothetical protein J7L94_00160 [Caldisericaceae bacterium]|nr:hypothetical protein [Caldisericaceae bacterium]